MLPFKADVSSLVPMHISMGTIKLNDTEVIKVELNKNIYQWTPDMIQLWYEKAAKRQPIEEIELTALMCSSSNMLNTLIDVLGRTINTKSGLKKFKIGGFRDGNCL